MVRGPFENDNYNWTMYIGIGSSAILIAIILVCVVVFRRKSDAETAVHAATEKLALAEKLIAEAQVKLKEANEKLEVKKAMDETQIQNDEAAATAALKSAQMKVLYTTINGTRTYLVLGLTGSEVQLTTSKSEATPITFEQRTDDTGYNVKVNDKYAYFGDNAAQTVAGAVLYADSLPLPTDAPLPLFYVSNNCGNVGTLKWKQYVYSDKNGWCVPTSISSDTCISRAKYVFYVE
jgi:hypothetical protein